MASLNDYPRVSLAADVAAFRLGAEGLEILLVERGVEPFRGTWALPGGFVKVSDDGAQGEAIEAAARRELSEETSLAVESSDLHTLGTWGAPGRDPRGRVLSVAYWTLFPATAPTEPRAGDDAARAIWHPASGVFDAGLSLAFDHASVLAEARNRIPEVIAQDLAALRHVLPSRFGPEAPGRIYGLFAGAAPSATRLNRIMDEALENEVIVETAQTADDLRRYRFTDST